MQRSIRLTREEEQAIDRLRGTSTFSSYRTIKMLIELGRVVLELIPETKVQLLEKMKLHSKIYKEGDHSISHQKMEESKNGKDKTRTK